MTPADAFLYEYAVVRYVPRVDREEFVNIGLVMMCKRRKWLKSRIYIDEEKLRVLNPACVIDRLRKQSSYFMRDDVPSKDIPVEERYRWLTAVKSAVLQVSPSHPGLLAIEEDREIDAQTAVSMLEAEFERLFASLVL